MRLVVDTNVFVSAALEEASWSGMVVRWVGKYGGLLETEATAQEVLEVLQRPHIAPRIAPFVFKNIRKVLAAAERVTISERTTPFEGSKDGALGSFTPPPAAS